MELIIYFSLLILAASTTAKFSCVTLSGEAGLCKPRSKCETGRISYNEIIRRMRYPKLEYCNRRKKNVCCPIASKPECYNADGAPGKCIDLNDFASRMPGQLNDTKFISDSFCLGKEQNVCYNPLPRSQMTTNNCEDSLTAFPPDPKSGCCGNQVRMQHRISDGSAASIYEYPWLAIIKYRNDREMCGGALISNKYVLTAAHCVFNSKPNRPVDVTLGEYDEDSDIDCVLNDCAHKSVTISIETVIPHPEYNPTDRNKRHDIALLRLSKAAPYTDFIRPICLPDVLNDVINSPPATLHFTVAGWGITDSKHSNSKIKHKVNVPFMDIKKCSRIYSWYYSLNLWTHQICAGGEGNADACDGDSGGPLMYYDGNQYHVSGIVSFGAKECGTDKIPGVYTRVSVYNTWIRRNIMP